MKAGREGGRRGGGAGAPEVKGMFPLEGRYRLCQRRVTRDWNKGQGWLRADLALYPQLQAWT